MTRESILQAFRAWGCHAYQAEFAADFLNEASRRHHLLLTPAGLGKVLVASQVVKFTVERERKKRVLVVAPSAFCMLWRSRLTGLLRKTPVEFMHGIAFRGGACTPTSETFGWPESVVAVVPCNAASNREVRRALASAHWDIVIFAEVQSDGRCKSLELYRETLAAGAIGRSLLISAAPLGPPADGSGSPLPDFHVTNWLGDLVDWDGNTIELPATQWKVSEYTRSEEEVRFLRLLQGELARTQAAPSPFRFETELLIRRAASSPNAVRRTLEIMGRKLSRSSLRELAAVSEKQHGDPTEVEDVAKLSFSPEARMTYVQFVQEAYGAFQEMKGDAKLACLLTLVEELAGECPGGICVLSSYADTVSYLRAALSEIGFPCVAISGGLRYAERQRAMEDFVREGGILLATAGALGEESDLNRVKHVVHYDLPASRSQVLRLEGRFGRINRTCACEMYALHDLSGAISHAPPIEKLISNEAFVHCGG